MKLDEVLSVVSDSGYRGLRGEGLLSDDTKSRSALDSGAVVGPNGAKSEQHDSASRIMRDTAGTHIAFPANLENLAFDVSGCHPLSLIPCNLNFSYELRGLPRDVTQ